MPSEKNLLREFGKASAGLAFPSNSAIDLPLTVGQQLIYTAPCDGVFFLEVAGYEEAGWINVYNTLTAGGTWRSQSSARTFGGLSTVNFQCRKGETLTVDTGNAVATTATCRFFRSLANALGGGLSFEKNQYVWRGLLCLASNPSFEVARLQLQRSVSTATQAHESRSPSRKSRRLTTRRVTAGLLSTQTEQAFKRSFWQTTSKSSLSTTSAHGAGVPCLLKKAQRSWSISGGSQAQTRIKPSLFRHVVSANVSRWEVAA